ncbi:hypothetical protein ACKKBF_B18185 [Auxenochlorella protothecoides x Auxenochlorella symbiontica]
MMGVQGALALVFLVTVLHTPTTLAASKKEHAAVVLRQVEVRGNGATTLALLDLLQADTENGGEADTQIRSDEERHTLQANVYSAKTPGGVRTRKLLMEDEDIPMYDDEGEVIEQSDLDDTMRNVAAAQAAADAFNAAQTSVVATSDQSGLNSLRKLQSVDCLTAAEERDSEDAADLDLESGESGLEWALARQITNAA